MRNNKLHEKEVDASPNGWIYIFIMGVVVAGVAWFLWWAFQSVFMR